MLVIRNWNGCRTAAFRFFPVEPDPELGWRLNFWDVAANKVLAFCGRDKLRGSLKGAWPRIVE
jgi:hypothetical protein